MRANGRPIAVSDLAQKLVFVLGAGGGPSQPRCSIIFGWRGSLVLVGWKVCVDVRSACVGNDNYCRTETRRSMREHDTKIKLRRISLMFL